ncbi:MAG: hypothetical protein ACO292_10180, partial [Ilumatobacteraceae bacterium]
SGEVLATCFEDSGDQCGSMTIGNVPRPVGVVADAGGELWVLSQDGLVVPISNTCCIDRMAPTLSGVDP